MTEIVKALAAAEPKGDLRPIEFSFPELGPEQVEVEVLYCGVCHSDLSLLNNEWGMTQYPLVPGHEVVGRVTAAGSGVRGLPGSRGNPVGKTVGIGWYSGSCMACRQCLSGNHNLCIYAEQTIVGRHGGFASRIRCHWVWAVPLPEMLDVRKAGPLFCGGLTVFNPIVQNDVRPTQRVGVIGIGGLGHLALQFLNKWGCEVYAFSSNPAKRDEILRLGAHHVLDSRNADQMRSIQGSLDFLLSTVNVVLDWDAYFGVLAPKGRMHFVGVVPSAIPVQSFTLIGAQKSVSGTPLGSPATLLDMLGFCARHGIEPVTEFYPMSAANDAIEHLDAGKARYRIVLENDLR